MEPMPRSKNDSYLADGRGPQGTGEELQWEPLGWEGMEITHYLSFEVSYNQMILERMAMDNL